MQDWMTTRSLKLDLSRFGILESSSGDQSSKAAAFWNGVEKSFKNRNAGWGSQQMSDQLLKIYSVNSIDVHSHQR